MNDVDIWWSEDGTTFEESAVFEERAGVPSIIQDASGRLIAAFQWFPENDDAAFDKIAVKISEDEGQTWTEPQIISISGLPTNYQRPFDPTLVLTDDDRIRLYFTSNTTGTKMLEGVEIYSAISTDGVNYVFEEGARTAYAEENAYDSAVGLLDGTWYLLTPGKPGEYFFQTSTDGLNFSEMETFTSGDQRNWTGNMVVIDGVLRFYGSGPSLWFAEYRDNAWTEPTTLLSPIGGDPGIAQLDSGKFLLLTVSQPRRSADR